MRANRPSPKHLIWQQFLGSIANDLIEQAYADAAAGLHLVRGAANGNSNRVKHPGKRNSSGSKDALDTETSKERGVFMQTRPTSTGVGAD